VTDRVVIPVPELGVLALDRETYQAALAEGAKLRAAPGVAAGAADADPLLDAEQLAKVLSVPASWVEQAAREKRIPSLQFGRWRRFRRREVEAAVRPASGQP
jgi:excisionase family DNA binding protein